MRPTSAMLQNTTAAILEATNTAILPGPSTIIGSTTLVIPNQIIDVAVPRKYPTNT